MDAERLRQIEEIYHTALEIPLGGRDAFLSKHCGEDNNLRREVESLLSFDDSPDSFLDTPPESLAAQMFAERDRETDLTGSEIGHYRVIRMLGKGGMGEVYLALDTNLNRQVALKFLPAELTGNADRLKRFEREAQTASGLNHPNILTIHQFGTDHESRFIVMEFVKGVTLSEKMAGGRLAISETLDIAVQVAAALAAAHEAGIIHRDIKPDNVMIRADGFVKVLDFGLAKLIEQPANILQTDAETATRAQVKTNPGAVMGTADYMSPEQARGLLVDTRTDIFSFGVMLYEMLTGERLFTGETVSHTIVNILEKEIPSVLALVADCPTELEEIIRRTLVKKPAERFRTAAELLPHLKKVQRCLEFEAAHRQTTQSNRTGEEQTQSFAATAGDRPVLPPNNLTANLSPLIGREKEIAELADLLKQENARLLTMVGIGGTGKTRLAQAVARYVLGGFPGGVFFVALGAISDSRIVVSTIAQALGVTESGGQPILAVLKDYLRDKEMLLVLDNFEQVVDAKEEVAELLDAANKIKLLITSREPLHLSAEREFAVLPLAVPSEEVRISFAELANYEAIRFFAERAQLAQPDFLLTEANIGSVAEISRRLDGLPLAIQLAAARVKVFTPAAIVTRLSGSLQLMTGGGRDSPARQQTMRGAIAWSYELLDLAEKKLFNRLAVFAGGFTFDAAEKIALSSLSAKEQSFQDEAPGNSGIDIYDGISSLLDKSLLARRDPADGEPRFRLLVVVREFALEKLAESGEADKIRRRHAEFYTDLSKTAEPELMGAKTAEWMEKLEREHDNFRRALEWTLSGAPEMSLQLVAVLYRFWLRRGFQTEGRQWIKRALEKSGVDTDRMWQAKAWRGGGLLSLQQDDFAAANIYIEESLRLSRELGDKQLICYALNSLGAIRVSEGDFPAAQPLTEECLTIAGEIGDQTQISIALNRLGDMSRQQDDYRAARQYYEEAYGIAKRESIAAALPIFAHNLASVLCLLADYPAARLYAAENLQDGEAMGHQTSIAGALNVFAALAVKTARAEKAARLFGAAQSVYEAASYKLEKADLDFNDRYLRDARAAIGDAAFDAAYAKGREMPLKEAIALAREEDATRQTENQTVQITGEEIIGATNFQPANTGDQPPAAGSVAIQPAAEALTAPGSVTPKTGFRQIFLWLLLTAGISIIGIGAFSLFKYAGDGPEAKPLRSAEPMKQTRLTTLGRVLESAISPDGRFFSYVLQENDKSALYVRQTATNSTINVLPATDSTYHELNFSPDGNYIYFTQPAAPDSSTSDLYRVETLGGAPRKLISDIDSGASFAPGGEQFVFRRNSSARQESALFIADADGANERRIAARRLPDAFFWGPAWSPDGKTIATFARNATEETTLFTVVAINLADGAEKILGQRWTWARKLIWLPDGKGLLINAQEKTGGPYQIWRMAYPGGAVSTVTNDFNSYQGVSVTSDAAALVTLKNDKPANIYTAPIADLKNARQLTSAEGVKLDGVSWTPDGRIVYGSDAAAGKLDLWIMNSDGSAPRQLTNDNFGNYNPVVSPDGRFIVFVSDRAGKYNLWRMDLSGGNLMQITNGTGEFEPSITPDSRSVVYSSTVASEQTALLWRVPTDGGEPVKLTSSTSHYPAVSPDGKSIAFMFCKNSDCPYSFSLMPAAGGTPKELIALQPDQWHWTPDSRALVYSIASGGASNLFELPVSGGQPRPITDFKSGRIFGFDFSPDGKTLVYLRGTANSDVIMISNFK